MKISLALASKSSVPFYLHKSLRQKKKGCNRKPMCLTVEVSEVFYKMESYKNKLHTKHRYKSCLKLYAIISFLSTLYNHYWTTHTFYSLLKESSPVFSLLNFFKIAFLKHKSYTDWYFWLFLQAMMI